MNASIETLMYQLGQVFLVPVLAAVAILFLYAFYALGAFAVQAWQRRAGMNPGSGYPLLAYARANPDHTEDDLDVALAVLIELAEAEPGCRTHYPKPGDNLDWDSKVTVKVLNACFKQGFNIDRYCHNVCTPCSSPIALRF